MKYINHILQKDCIKGLKIIEDNSLDLCVTDPPYNYEFLNHEWDHDEVNRRIEHVKNSNTLIKHLPYGSGLSGGVRNERWYKKNHENVISYGKWCFKWGKEVFRTLKPGAFILVFNSSKTIGHVQVALENAGFYPRDIIVWRKNSGIPKGLNFSKKLEKTGIKNWQNWEGWNSCLRNEWEGILVLQKPLINNYQNTIKLTGLGLFNTSLKEGKFQSNVLENIKRDKKDKFNFHCTIKPLNLIEHIIKMCLPLEDSRIVLDPFMGSGTTAIAAKKLGINYTGFEINKEYHKICLERINQFSTK